MSHLLHRRLDRLLELLGKKAGPEDIRTIPNAMHDALEEGSGGCSPPGACPTGPASPSSSSCT